MSFLRSVALTSPPFEVSTDQDISPVSPGVMPALRAIVFSVACVRVNLGFAPKSLFIRSTGLDRFPPFFTKTTSYSTYAPSCAPPPFQDRTILSADVTSSATFAGEMSSSGTVKSVESWYSFLQPPNRKRAPAIINNIRFFMIFILKVTIGDFVSSCYSDPFHFEESAINSVYQHQNSGFQHAHIRYLYPPRRRYTIHGSNR